MPWWDELDSDPQNDFIDYLRAVVEQKHGRHNFKLIEEIILPILQYGKGEIREDLSMEQMAQDFGTTTGRLMNYIRELYDGSIERLSTKSAAAFSDRSDSTIRRWMRSDPLLFTDGAKTGVLTRRGLLAKLT